MDQDQALDILRQHDRTLPLDAFRVPAFGISGPADAPVAHPSKRAADALYTARKEAGELHPWPEKTSLKYARDYDAACAAIARPKPGTLSTWREELPAFEQALADLGAEFAVPWEYAELKHPGTVQRDTLYTGAFAARRDADEAAAREQARRDDEARKRIAEQLLKPQPLEKLGADAFSFPKGCTLPPILHNAYTGADGVIVPTLELDGRWVFVVRGRDLMLPRLAPTSYCAMLPPDTLIPADRIRFIRDWTSQLNFWYCAELPDCGPVPWRTEGFAEWSERHDEALMRFAPLLRNLFSTGGSNSALALESYKFQLLAWLMIRVLRASPDEATQHIQEDVLQRVVRPQSLREWRPNNHELGGDKGAPYPVTVTHPPEIEPIPPDMAGVYQPQTPRGPATIMTREGPVTINQDLGGAKPDHRLDGIVQLFLTALDKGPLPVAPIPVAEPEKPAAPDPLAVALAQFVDGKQAEFTSAQVFDSLVSRGVPVDPMTPQHHSKVRRILSSLGWTKREVVRAGVRLRVFQRVAV